MARQNPSLPPHGGRTATLSILGMALESHLIDTLVLPAHAPDMPATRLFLARPRQGATGRVLFMLDGTAAFDFLTPTLLAAHPGLAVVGVGHDGAQQFARSARVQDYSPPTCPGAPLREDPHHPGRMAGGAEAFRARLLGPIREAAEKALGLDVLHRTLWGHSFGGLFTLYCAATAPAAFDRYAVISPSIWWDSNLIRGIVQPAQFDGQEMLFAVGDREQRSGSDGPPPEGPPPATLAMGDLLQGLPGLTLRREVYAGAVHIAALPASLPGALALASA